MTSPTFSQIKAQVAAIRKKIPEARTIAIRAKGRWAGEPVLEDGDERYLIRQCDSPLAMRIALREAGEDVTKVLITGLDDLEIGDDILVRLKPRRLVPLDSWQIVKSLFHARTIDPRITQHGWIAESLMGLVPAEGFPPAAGGFLDAETVWPILLGGTIGLTAKMPDLLAILNWSTVGENVERFRSAPDTFRDAAVQWLDGRAGSSATTVLKCVMANKRPDALPIGLAAGVVFHRQAAGQLEKAAGKMEERFLGSQSPERAIIDGWHTAATEVVRTQLTDPRAKQQLLQRADEILGEVGAHSHAWLSDTSPLGFDQRLAAFGERLSEALPACSPQSVGPLADAREAVLRHDRSARERRRLERVEMAMRLVRWLGTQNAASEPQSLEEAASQYLTEGGFLDWARLSLRSGDPVRELSAAYAKLFEQITARREHVSQRFANLLRDWTAAKTTGGELVPVEQMMERVVAPVAAHTRVLVIVIDAMSVAVFRELMADIRHDEWISLTEGGLPPRPGLAAIPSVTEASRTSLLCGRLTNGNADAEEKGFSELPALVSECREGHPPRLFHKASLQESDDASLAGEIRKEIGSAHRKIVGVVINAVDDHLLKGEQIDTRWTRDEIKVLPVLLHEARVARRTVILLSDHGHVLDCGAKGRAHEGGERWRCDEGEPAEYELCVKGARVVIPESKTLIAPWTEKVRYGSKKNGYHGGLTPQEMVVPIAVLCPTDTFPDGWAEAPVDTPSWWEEPTDEPETAERPEPRLKPAKLEVKAPDLLFEIEEKVRAVEETAEPTHAEPAPEWIAALLSSPIFKEQKEIGGRAVPADEVLSRLLAAIDCRGGKITSAALSRAIQYSPMRLRGLLAVAQRVLNIDGYAVLTRDEASDTVEFDRDLLCKQFDLV